MNRLCVFLILLVTSLAWAEAKQQLTSTWEDTFIQSNKDISAWFDGVTEGIDLFLVGEKISKERNKSSFRIDNTTTTTEGDNLENTTSLAINPRLQNLEEFLQLKFTSYDEKSDSRGVEAGYLRKTQRKKNYGASVAFFRKLGNIRTEFKPRIQLEDPLQVSHSLSFESVADIKKFQVNPKFELFANADKGTGTFQALNLHYEFNQIYGVTFINEGEYLDKLHKLSVVNGVAFSQDWSEKTAFTYSFIFNSNNREKYHLEGYSPSITWHQNIYKKILDFQLTPHLDFEKMRRFKGQAGLIFNLSLNF